MAGSPDPGAATSAVVAGGGEGPSAIKTFMPPAKPEPLPQECAPTHTTCLRVPCYGAHEATCTWSVLGACVPGLRRICTSAHIILYESIGWVIQSTSSRKDVMDYMKIYLSMPNFSRVGVCISSPAWLSVGKTTDINNYIVDNCDCPHCNLVRRACFLDFFM